MSVAVGQIARLPQGGLIDRSQPLSFTFDGRHFQGYAGDTLASALLANGQRIVGRSFKYHRPRGILSAGVEEPNALVELRTGARREPNTRATVAELYDGLSARSQNRWPSLTWDLQAVNQLLSPVIGAGFYYKTFMWPKGFWEKVYEPLIRRAAGLGRAAQESDPDSYEKCHAFCDVLVIGGGPSGMMATINAARTGARVLLVDDDTRLGGRCLDERRVIADEAADQWAHSIEQSLLAMPNVQLLSRTTVFASYDHGVFGALERVHDHVPVPPPFEPRQRLWRITARQTVLAAGAIEQPPLFAGNDLPGVMLAGAVRSYINRYAVLPGRAVAVFTTSDDGWQTAADLANAGAGVVAVIDPRDGVPAATRALLPAGVECICGVVSRALGGRELEAIEVLGQGGNHLRFNCDVLAVSGGWAPSLHLSQHQGGAPRWDERLAAFVPQQVPACMQVVGAANGQFSTSAALAAGARAGAAAAQSLGFDGSRVEWPAADFEPTAQSAPRPVSSGNGKVFVDFQNDVTADDILLAEREGFRSVEHLKRYTTLGMATDQGKTSSVNALGLLAAQLGSTIGEVGTTRSRPPFVPVAIGALAGEHRGAHFRPTRLPPSHRWAIEQGAEFIEAGAWLRAAYFPRSGEADWLASVKREVPAVRNGVGICDVSTLGKIDVQGPDALKFLELLYANSFQTLAIGRCRYGLMLREDGFVMDDGTVSRLAAQRYLITTTTANAVAVFQHMQLCHQVLWPALAVQFSSVTEQWAQYSIAGPNSRRLLQVLVDPAHDLTNTGFPYLAAADIRLADGIAARLFRISFSGELAYELAVPSRSGEAVWRKLFELGADLNLTAYGIESLNVMRIEKGHVAGSELTGQVTAYDLGLGRMASARKDYIGATLARRAALTDPDRPRLVGLKPLDPNERFSSGAHLTPLEAAPSADNDQGHVTAVAWSPTLGSWIGLALLRRGPERHGEKLRASDPLRGRSTVVQVCEPVFVDVAGERLHG